MHPLEQLQIVARLGRGQAVDLALFEIGAVLLNNAVDLVQIFLVRLLELRLRLGIYLAFNHDLSKAAEVLTDAGDNAEVPGVVAVHYLSG